MNTKRYLYARILTLLLSTTAFAGLEAAQEGILDLADQSVHSFYTPVKAEDHLDCSQSLSCLGADHDVSENQTGMTSAVYMSKEQYIDAQTEKALQQIQQQKELSALEEENRPIRVLSLDGGGIRGVGTAEIIRVMGNRIKERTGKELHEFFDLVVGTSTGGIIAVAIANGLNGQELVDIYSQDGTKIFQKRWFGGWWGPKFSPEGLKTAIQQRLGNKTGKADLKLKDAKTKVGVTTYESETQQTHLLTNDITQPGEQVNFDGFAIPAGEVDVVKAVRATSAAPSYFPGVHFYEGMVQHQDGQTANITGMLKQGKKHLYVDGGLGANNPTAMAYQYVKMLKEQGVFGSNRKVQIVSLGTGAAKPTVLEKDGGLFKFLYRNGVSHVMNGGQNQAIQNFELNAKKLSQKGKMDYFRIQFDLDTEIDLADARPEVINMLVAQAHKATETNYFDQMIDVICGHSLKKFIETN
jgi:hypothetical protein